MVCKGMKFTRFPLDEHVCYLKLTSCKYNYYDLRNGMNVRFIFAITENTFFLKGFKSRLEDVFFWCEVRNQI